MFGCYDMLDDIPEEAAQLSADAVENVFAKHGGDHPDLFALIDAEVERLQREAEIDDRRQRIADDFERHGRIAARYA